MAEYLKPLPKPTTDAKPFWESCQHHAMALQRCAACNTFRYPPRPLCPNCHATQAEWQMVSGRGRVYVSLAIYRSPGSAWETDVPYNVSMIELEEGPRIWSNVVDCGSEEVHIGDEVEIVYDDVTDTITLPKFRKISPQ